VFRVSSGIGGIGRDDGFNVRLEGKCVITEEVPEGLLTTNFREH
jgi:hypothetical protein